MWLIKPDKRFKPGNIKQDGNKLRGHPDTVSMKTYALPSLTPGMPKATYIDAMTFALAPPVVVTGEMAKALKGRL